MAQVQRSSKRHRVFGKKVAVHLDMRFMVQASGKYKVHLGQNSRICVQDGKSAALLCDRGESP